MSDATTAEARIDRSRVRPEQALRPGRADAGRLLVFWYLRKSAYWLLFTGTTAAYLFGRTDETDVDWADAGAVVAELLSPLAGLVLAVVVRIGSSLGALVLAYSLARDYEVPLEPRTGFGSGIGRLLDRRNLAKAFRSLRWTHHVRQEALRRLGPAGERVSKLDPILDIVNISTFVVMMTVVVFVAAVT